MKVSILAAVADNRVIGRNGALPWHLPADLRRFKELTMGHHVIMGRRTWESVGRELPGRTMVVVSRGAPELPARVRIAPSLDAALETARGAGDEEAFVVGGAEIYGEALPRADRLYLTRVHAEPEGDAFFPLFDEGDWTLVSREDRPADERHAHALSFLVYERG